ncbi:MAG: hypothetical protein H0T72_09210 [Chloroflexia bacterium]|nr:hypothetical protein [Chloroflexia bacterium]
MAQSILRPRSVRLRPRWSVDAGARQIRLSGERIRDAYRRDPRLFFWKLLWLPFWLGGDAPSPALPVTRSATSGNLPADPAGAYLTTRIDRVTRRFGIAWFAGSLLRGLTLALFVLTVWVALAVISGVPLPGWLAISILLSMGVVLGGVYGWLARPDRLMVARMLDRTFDLRERIVTAFDRSIDAGSHVSRLQLADAANTFDEIVTEVPRSAFLPVREAALCLITAGALVTVLLAWVPHAGIAAIAESPVPQFVPASERLAAREQVTPVPPVAEAPVAERATIAEIQERGRESQSAREDLARIGDALRDHALTQPAAESIASGDYAAAADSLRSASESAGAMSQEGREALAEDLEGAAQDVSEENSELAQAANDAASALREGGPEGEAALGQLADQVEETSAGVESQEDLARDLEQAQTGSGDPSSASEGSQGEQPGSEQSSSGEGQSGGEQPASDPGEGSSAQPGVSNQPQESSESSSSTGGAEGASEEGGGSSSASEGAGEQPGEGQPGDASGDPSSAGSGSAADGSGADQQGLQGAPDDETSASQGSGAGAGQSGANDQNTSDQSVDSPSQPEEKLGAESEVAGAGEAGEPPPSRADRGEEDDGTGTTPGGSASLELQGTSDSGVQTGGDSGSSSLGSGSGSTTASGDEAQGEVGLAGPDSNRAPDDLRDVVRDFFEGPEE